MNWPPHARVASRIWENVESVCANLSGFDVERSLRANMDIRALLSSITRRPWCGRGVEPGFRSAGETVLPFSSSVSQTSVGSSRSRLVARCQIAGALRACSALCEPAWRLRRPLEHSDAFGAKLLRATHRIHASATSDASAIPPWRPGRTASANSCCLALLFAQGLCGRPLKFAGEQGRATTQNPALLQRPGRFRLPRPIALEAIGPTPGAVMRRWQCWSSSASASISAVVVSTRASSRRQSSVRS